MRNKIATLTLDMHDDDRDYLFGIVYNLPEDITQYAQLSKSIAKASKLEGFFKDIGFVIIRKDKVLAVLSLF